MAHFFLKKLFVLTTMSMFPSDNSVYKLSKQFAVGFKIFLLFAIICFVSQCNDKFKRQIVVSIRQIKQNHEKHNCYAFGVAIRFLILCHTQKFIYKEMG